MRIKNEKWRRGERSACQLQLLIANTYNQHDLDLSKEIRTVISVLYPYDIPMNICAICRRSKIKLAALRVLLLKHSNLLLSWDSHLRVYDGEEGQVGQLWERGDAAAHLYAA